MFLLACIDMIAIPCDSIISGIQCILGIHYCTNPIFFYVVGCGSIGAWLGATLTCILLAVDRFFQMIFPEAAKIIFGRRMMFFWLALPPCYMVWYLFCIPGFFNNIYHGFYFDPFYGIKGLEGNSHVTLYIFFEKVSNLVLWKQFNILGCQQRSCCCWHGYPIWISLYNNYHQIKGF